MVILTKNFYNPTPTWDEINKNIEESKSSGGSFRRIGGCFTTTVDGHTMKSAEAVLGILGLTVAHIYVSTAKGNHGFGKHNDTEDVYFWQCQGSTKWITDLGEYTLEPGDVIYVPAGVNHEVISLTPRAGISMSK
jgi:mannose-6-phosphate isomerase-like protein (cupin superfamily)